MRKWFFSLAALTLSYSGPVFAEGVMIAQKMNGAKNTARAGDNQSYQAKDYSHLLGMPGFSDQLLKMHFQLYQGYVKNTNLLMTSLDKLAKADQLQSYEFGALQRRFSWEFDGMRLHELYFENLGGNGTPEASNPLYRQLAQDFGSYDEWKKGFIATGMMRGIGWVILYRDPQSGRLMNIWINEHDVGHLAGGNPLLVMDVFEHAYMPQYGLDKNQYIQAFFSNINWGVVDKRYSEVLKSPVIQ